MAWKFVLVLGMTTALLVARETSAVEITPTDLDTWLTTGAGNPFLPPTPSDLFDAAPPGPTPLGSLSNAVYRNDSTGLFTYVHTVLPAVNNATFFNTGFELGGFSGIAGWAFTDSVGAGGCGGPVNWLLQRRFHNCGGQTTISQQVEVPLERHKVSRQDQHPSACLHQNPARWCLWVPDSAFCLPPCGDAESRNAEVS
jgi:hypothetical protein